MSNLTRISDLRLIAASGLVVGARKRRGKPAAPADHQGPDHPGALVGSGYRATRTGFDLHAQPFSWLVVAERASRSAGTSPG